MAFFIFPVVFSDLCRIFWISMCGLDGGLMMYKSYGAPFIGFSTSESRPFVLGNSILTPFEHPYI